MSCDMVNAGLLLRRAISIQAERREIASEARYRAGSCKALFGGGLSQRRGEILSTASFEEMTG